MSRPATYTWRIDLTPPTLTERFPAFGKAYDAAGWSTGCRGAAGVCGSATDRSGIGRVRVSIRNAAGKYWSGAGFSSATEVYNTATLSALTTTGASWSYPLRRPVDGGYTVHVTASDKVGNATGSPLATSFAIDTVPPPAPSSNPSQSSPTSSTSITFNLTDAAAAVTYRCQLDGGAWTSCSTPKAYSGLSAGNHTFAAEAVDAAGNVSAASTTFSWRVVTLVPLGIAGNVPNPLYPGAAAQTIPLTLTNTMAVPVTVTGISASVQSTGVSGCQPGWFSITQSNVSNTNTLTVPANGSLSVPQSYRPSIAMKDSGTSQDACQRATLTLSYAGTATS